LAEQFRRRFAKPSRQVGSATPARDSIYSSIGVDRYTLMAVRKDLPNRSTGRDTLMLDHFADRGSVSRSMCEELIDIVCSNVY